MHKVDFDPSRLRGEDVIRWQQWSASAYRATQAVLHAMLSGQHPKLKPEIWMVLEHWLLRTVFYGKCAYCERYVGGGYYGDHYRPARKVMVREEGRILQVTKEGSPHPGYPWVAYDWRNLLPSCEFCSRRKGDQFPVNARHVFDPEGGPDPDILDELEQPLLLNPYKAYPSQHLKFGVKGVVAPLSRRGEESIEILGLNREQLCVERQMQQEKAWSAFMVTVDQSARQPRPIGELLERYMERYTGPRAPFSQAVRDYLERKLSGKDSFSNVGTIISGDQIADDKGTEPRMQSRGPIGTAERSHSDSERVRIHVRAQADPECLVGDMFTASVVLSREEIRRVGGLADVGDDVNVAEEKPLIVEAVPRAHLDTVGAARKEVMVPGPEKPQAVLFNLRATHQGMGELWIIVSQGQVPLCNLVLSIRIIETPTGNAAQAADEASVALTGHAIPLHMLRIIEQQQGDSIVYRYDLEAPDLELLAAFASRPVEQNRDVYVRSLYRRIEDSWGTCQHDAEKFHDELRAFGGELLDELMPAELRRLLWENRHRLHNIIVLSTEPFIPWELLHLKAPDTSRLPDETCFLGQLGLVRWLWGTWPPERLVLRPGRARFITPDYPDKRYRLPSVRAEQRFLVQHLKAMAVEPHYRQVMALLRSGEFDLLHFAGHAVAASEDIANAQLLLEGHRESGPEGDSYVLDPLGASVIGQHMASAGARPIVVINACQAGRLGHQLSSMGGFAVAFLGRGAGVFVSTLWSVGDTPALVFVEAFYRRLLAGGSLAEAAIAGREAARELGDATWLAYTVYGHPEARIVEPQ